MIIKINKQYLDSNQVVVFSLENIKDFLPVSIDGNDVYVYTMYEPQEILCPYQQVAKSEITGQLLSEIEIPES